MKHANFFISASILFKLCTDDPWVLVHYGAEEGEVKGHVGVKRSGGIWSCASLFLSGCTYVTLWLKFFCPVVYVCDTLVKVFV